MKSEVENGPQASDCDIDQSAVAAYRVLACLLSQGRVRTCQGGYHWTACQHHKGTHDGICLDSLRSVLTCLYSLMFV